LGTKTGKCCNIAPGKKNARKKQGVRERFFGRNTDHRVDREQGELTAGGGVFHGERKKPCELGAGGTTRKTGKVGGIEDWGGVCEELELRMLVMAETSEGGDETE